jgi:hypothetical protein
LRERCRKLETGVMSGAEGAVIRSACPPASETSYWQGGAIEMAAINTILIIVNSVTA